METYRSPDKKPGDNMTVSDNGKTHRSNSGVPRVSNAARVKPSLIDLEARWGNKAEGESRRERLSEMARKGCDSPNMRNI